MRHEAQDLVIRYFILGKNRITNTMVRIILIAGYLICMIGCWCSYAEKGVKAGCLPIFFSFIPVINLIIFALFIGRTDNKGRLKIMELFANTKETISDIFSNDD